MSNGANKDDDGKQTPPAGDSGGAGDTTDKTKNDGGAGDSGGAEDANAKGDAGGDKKSDDKGLNNKMFDDGDDTGDAGADKEKGKGGARPDYFPEKHWKDGDAAASMKSLAEAYTALEGKMSNGDHKFPKDGKYDLGSFNFLADAKVMDDPISADDIAESEIVKRVLDLSLAQKVNQETFDGLGALVKDILSEVQIGEKRTREELLSELGGQPDAKIKLFRDLIGAMPISEDQKKLFESAASTNPQMILLTLLQHQRYTGATIPMKALDMKQTSGASTLEDIARLTEELHAHKPGSPERISKQAELNKAQESYRAAKKAKK